MPRKKKPLPLLLAEMTVSSWETIAHRSAMMAAGTCSQQEYRRMLEEKLRATQRNGVSLMTGAAGPDLLSRMVRPWHSGATRNAKRLRKRKRSTR